MVALGTQVQGIKQCIALRGAVDDERCWQSLAHMDALLTQAEQHAERTHAYLDAEGACNASRDHLYD